LTARDTWCASVRSRGLRSIAATIECRRVFSPRMFQHNRARPVHADGIGEPAPCDLNNISGARACNGRTRKESCLPDCYCPTTRCDGAVPGARDRTDVPDKVRADTTSNQSGCRTEIPVRMSCGTLSHLAAGYFWPSPPRASTNRAVMEMRWMDLVAEVKCSSARDAPGRRRISGCGDADGGSYRLLGTNSSRYPGHSPADEKILAFGILAHQPRNRYRRACGWRAATAPPAQATGRRFTTGRIRGGIMITIPTMKCDREFCGHCRPRRNE